MNTLRVQFLGSGDAFGSGGRLQASILLTGMGESLLLDCGASVLIGMKRAGVDPSGIGCVLVSHLHGDHFGGIPFFILDAQFAKRERPLLVAGPPGIRERVEATMELLFPGSSQVKRRFEVKFLELVEREAAVVGSASVTAYRVDHASGAPAYALRVELAGKAIAYSGDTEWTDSLVDAARGAHLFICEAYFFDKKITFHLDYQTLVTNRQRLDCGRVVLTHMSKDMLDRVDVELERAEDGLLIEL